MCLILKQSWKAVAIKHSGHSEEEMHQTVFYLHGLHYRFHLNILISLTSFMSIPNSVTVLYNNSPKLYAFSNFINN